MAEPISVSQALNLAKASLSSVSATIVGEVSELSDKPGYKAVYFTLTDESSALSCLMWRSAFSTTGIEMKQGMLVEVSGVFSVYAAKGRMNFDVKRLKLAGEGDLRLKVAKLAKKLEVEGLMAASRKRPLPKYPSAVAIVTSPRGKAIHDVLRTLRRRFPLVEVLICGVPVEGADAARSIIAGLEVAQSSAAEVILLVRGGGSYEDLMPFNDEGLARAVAASKVPVVTGIGHEPDNSIADMVADFRASTPTAAAERIVPDSSELASGLERTEGVLTRLLIGRLQQDEARYRRLAERPIFTDPDMLYAQHELHLEGAERRLYQAIPQRLAGDRATVKQAEARLTSIGMRLTEPFSNRIGIGAAKLDSLSPLKVLGRGYSIVFDEEGHVLDSVDKVDFDRQIKVRFADGVLSARPSSKEHVKLMNGNGVSEDDR
ncbi:MAG TPA: exodeoxyribonuclease VII large subunit [Coriobacteriia bacterium]|nr:exodeoxyribonuclease VII large subunit [Coriobacteriia bacterium]